jgi:hypothetical protein
MFRTKLAQALTTIPILLLAPACSDDPGTGWEPTIMPPGGGYDDGYDDGGDGEGDDSGGDSEGDTWGDDGSDTWGDDGGDTWGDDGGATGDDGGGSTEPPNGSPYQGGWDIGDCQDSIVPDANSPGEADIGGVLHDWTLPDQFGDQVRFYDFCHKVIFYYVVTES